MTVLGIIPARYESSRFPGKPLVDIKGKSMIQRVYEQVAKADLIDKVVVATDDERILTHVESFGGSVMMTAVDHQSGTDRCAEVAKAYGAYDFVVNIQGDEPFIHPADIDKVIRPLLAGDAPISTLVTPIKNIRDLLNINTVKAIKNKQQQAVYFSRLPIPFQRNTAQEEWLDKHQYYKHLGIYGFQSDVLQGLTNLDVSALEQAESLEQLRWLENGYTIYIDTTPNDSIGIDTPDDLKAAIAMME